MSKAPKEKMEPFLLIQHDDPTLNHYKQVYNTLSDPIVNTLNAQVTMAHVETLSTGEITQMMACMQHYPDVIERMIFAINIGFVEVEDSELYVPEDQWKSEPAFQRWFAALHTFPAMIFFLNDDTARLYTLIGDLIADGAVEVVPDEDGGKYGKIAFAGEVLQNVCDRLFTACWFMLMFCHRSGFNPQAYIESVIADYGLPVTYEMVYEKYKEDSKKDIYFRSQMMS